MKKTRYKEIAKMAAVSAFAIGIFSAALIGANNLAFAAATNGTQAIPSATEIADTPLVAAPADFQAPNLNVISSSSNNVHANNTISAAAMSMENAAQIGAQYIWDVFGESIDGMYVEMMFANWPSHSRTYWLGGVSLTAPTSAEDIESRIARNNDILYRFAIDAVTGLRVDISPGFGHLPQPSNEERQALPARSISDEVMAWHIAWDEKTTTERITYLGLSHADIEPYLQAAREFARSHFNNSALAYETESFEVFHDMVDRFSIDSVGFGGIVFSLSDDTGREAEIWINAGTRCLRPGSGIRTQDNDFIPGFIYDRPGIG